MDQEIAGARPDQSESTAFPFTLSLEHEAHAVDAIQHSLSHARSLADLLNTAAESDGFESMRDGTISNLSAMLLGLIEDAIDKLDRCTVARKESAND